MVRCARAGRRPASRCSVMMSSRAWSGLNWTVSGSLGGRRRYTQPRSLSCNASLLPPLPSRPSLPAPGTARPWPPDRPARRVASRRRRGDHDVRRTARGGFHNTPHPHPHPSDACARVCGACVSRASDCSKQQHRNGARWRNNNATPSRPSAPASEQGYHQR